MAVQVGADNHIHVLWPHAQPLQVAQESMVAFQAEQLEPVSREVALKIIKLGMDTKQVISRFEAERQALAMMDHPNIAKVLDAGATETGRPYFVMEYVTGTSLEDVSDDDIVGASDLEVAGPGDHSVRVGICGSAPDRIHFEAQFPPPNSIRRPDFKIQALPGFGLQTDLNLGAIACIVEGIPMTASSVEWHPLPCRYQRVSR